MEYFVLSFIAGVLTILAPCVFPMLPIILGGSLGAKNLLRPFVVILSLSISILVFTLALKVFALGIPQNVLTIVSSAIITFFGITLLFPHLWDKISMYLGLSGKSQELMQKSSKKEGIWGYILLGASLGPVFSACSPTYFLIVGTVLPQDFVIGLINLLIYTSGLFLSLFLIAIFGQKITAKFMGVASADGIIKKILGIMFIALGIAIFFGYDKVFESWLLDHDFFLELATLESRFTGE